MSYDEWLYSIKLLEKSNNVEVKDNLLDEEFNPNLVDRLEPKLIELIKTSFIKNVERIKASLDNIFDDNNILDLTLVDFKKKVKFVYELTNIKEIRDEKKESLKKMIVDETNKVYDILLDEARISDPYGILEQTIKNNRIKWS